MKTELVLSLALVIEDKIQNLECKTEIQRMKPVGEHEAGYTEVDKQNENWHYTVAADTPNLIYDDMLQL